jgi:hypothetical protein
MKGTIPMFSINHLPRRARRAGVSTLLASATALSLFSGMVPSASADDLSVSINDIAVTEGVDANAVFTVTVSGTHPKHPNQGITVEYETIDDSAVAGLDYTYVHDTLTIDAGLESKTISIPLIDDATYEPLEQFKVKLLSSSVDIADKGAGTGVATITSDDPKAKLRIQDAEVTEGSGDMVFNVTLDRPVNVNVLVDYKTIDGSAEAGSDYTAKSNTLTFPADTNDTQQIRIPIKNDIVYEGKEDFQVQLYNNFNANIAREFGTGTIDDDEVKPVLSVSGDFSVDESDSVANVVVKLTGLTQDDVTFTYDTTDGKFPAAHSGTDYVGVNGGTGTIHAGTTESFVSVKLMDDNKKENDENFNVSLSNPQGARLGSATATITIKDND